MTATPEQAPPRGLGRVLMGAILFSLFAPAALLALPLAALLFVAGPRSAGDRALAIIAAGFGLWWLLQPGDLADQTARAAVVIATVIFAGSARTSLISVTHRALAAIAGATAGVIAMFVVLGRGWRELNWDVAHRAGFAVRLALGAMWQHASRGPDGLPTVSGNEILVDLSRSVNGAVKFMSDYYPATLALELLAAFALATALCQRLRTAPPGAPLGRLREFRFSEHLGWGLALSLLTLLLPPLAAGRVAAGNVLLVTAALYAVRGLGVATYLLAMIGGGGLAVQAAIALAVVFMLPVVAAGIILLGVLDAGLDLRRRWSTPSAGA